MIRRTAITVGLLFSVALFATAVLSQRSGQALAQPAEPKQPVREKEIGPRPLLGVSSCSASVCHGGGELGKPFSEATTWRSLDPHARAYDTLLSQQSQAMAKILWSDKTPAHEASLCLKCHVNSDYDLSRPTFRKVDGVGCESCHGAAKDWLKPHYRANWKDADRQALGLTDTKGLHGRANVCVKCHVGTPDANVDHDLIAAGHPALRFEFATYFANLPPHWDVAKDKRANSTHGGKAIDFEARAWAIGQVVSAQAALEVMASRVDPGRPWPEFAEFDCFACHHDLQSGKGRQNKKHLGDRRPGSLVWNSWYFAIVSGASIQRTPPHALLDPPVFHDFRAKTRDRTELAKQARHAAANLKTAAASPWLSGGPGQLESGASWDQVTQHYLGLLSLRQQSKDNNQRPDADLERRVVKLRSEVTFAPGFNNPRR